MQIKLSELKRIIRETLGSVAHSELSVADPVTVNAKRKFHAAAKPIITSFIKALQALEQRKVITAADARAIRASFVSDVMMEHNK